MVNLAYTATPSSEWGRNHAVHWATSVCLPHTIQHRWPLFTAADRNSADPWRLDELSTTASMERRRAWNLHAVNTHDQRARVVHSLLWCAGAANHYRGFYI